jgi:hypothetical protein
MLTTNSMSRDLRIVSTPTNPLSKHLVALLKGLLAAQLCTVPALDVRDSPIRVLCQFSKPPPRLKAQLQLATLFHLRVLHFTRGFTGLFAMCCLIVVRSVAGE